MRKAPLGKNEIRKSLSIKAKNAWLQLEGKRVTNHSARKTCISRLFDADILENFVAQLRSWRVYNLTCNQQVINTKREYLGSSAELTVLNPEMKLSQVCKVKNK